MFFPTNQTIKDDRKLQSPDSEVIIVPTKSGVAAVEVKGNMSQLQPHERLLSDSGKGALALGGSLVGWHLVYYIALSFPLILAFLLVAVFLSAHSLRGKLDRYLRTSLIVILSTSFSIFAFSQYQSYQRSQSHAELPGTHRSL